MKIEVPMPDYIKREYATVCPRCYLITSPGPYEGYHAVVVPLLATFGLMLMKEKEVFTRWCYAHRATAVTALDLWDGRFDPPGDWIKQKPEDRYGPGTPLAIRDRGE